MPPEEFNPFTILPRSLMLRVLHHTFEHDASGDFKNFMDYDAVSDELGAILGDKDNLQYTLDSMPTEFNIELIKTLRLAKINTQSGRYRLSVAFLFLKYLYQHVKPFPNDEFLSGQYDYYQNAISHIYEYFYDYPMVMYVNAYVAFYIAKRLFTSSSVHKHPHKEAGQIFLLAAKSIERAHELEHPLACLFYNDMCLQMVRNSIHVEDHIKEKLPKSRSVKLADVLAVLSKKAVNLDSFSDEDKGMLVVTWQKLLLENCARAQALFQFALNYDLLPRLTQYFYRCFVINHFHRHVLAYNPMFVSDNNEGILMLFKTYNVNALVNLHQSFRVYYPIPDSVLLSSILTLPSKELRHVQPLLDQFLTLPESCSRSRRICFIDAYRDAVDDGSLKTVSPYQMQMVLSYFSLVDRAGDIQNVVEREAHFLCRVLRCNIDIVHKIALAVCHQLKRFTTFDPLGHLDHQEILLTMLYQDREMLTHCALPSEGDFDRIAMAIIQSYKMNISNKVPTQPNIVVPEFIKMYQDQLESLKVDIHKRCVDLGYMKAA